MIALLLHFLAKREKNRQNKIKKRSAEEEKLTAEIAEAQRNNERVTLKDKMRVCWLRLLSKLAIFFESFPIFLIICNIILSLLILAGVVYLIVWIATVLAQLSVENVVATGSTFGWADFLSSDIEMSDGVDLDTGRKVLYLNNKGETTDTSTSGGGSGGGNTGGGVITDSTTLFSTITDGQIDTYFTDVSSRNMMRLIRMATRICELKPFKDAGLEPAILIGITITEKGAGWLGDAGLLRLSPNTLEDTSSALNIDTMVSKMFINKEGYEDGPYSYVNTGAFKTALVDALENNELMGAYDTLLQYEEYKDFWQTNFSSNILLGNGANNEAINEYNLRLFALPSMFCTAVSFVTGIADVNWREQYCQNVDMEKTLKSFMGTAYDDKYLKYYSSQIRNCMYYASHHIPYEYAQNGDVPVYQGQFSYRTGVLQSYGDMLQARVSYVAALLGYTQGSLSNLGVGVYRESKGKLGYGGLYAIEGTLYKTALAGKYLHGNITCTSDFDFFLPASEKFYRNGSESSTEVLPPDDVKLTLYSGDSPKVLDKPVTSVMNDAYGSNSYWTAMVKTFGYSSAGSNYYNMHAMAIEGVISYLIGWDVFEQSWAICVEKGYNTGSSDAGIGNNTFGAMFASLDKRDFVVRGQGTNLSAKALSCLSGYSSNDRAYLTRLFSEGYTGETEPISVAQPYEYYYDGGAHRGVDLYEGVLDGFSIMTLSNIATDCGLEQTGRAVIAVHDGTITVGEMNATLDDGTQTGGGFGNNVVLKFSITNGASSGDYQIIYGHMQGVKEALTKTLGKTPSIGIEYKVKRGDIVGYAGTTGKSQGGHLHFQVSMLNLEGYYIPVDGGLKLYGTPFSYDALVTNNYTSSGMFVLQENVSCFKKG